MLDFKASVAKKTERLWRMTSEKTSQCALGHWETGRDWEVQQVRLFLLTVSQCDEISSFHLQQVKTPSPKAQSQRKTQLSLREQCLLQTHVFLAWISILVEKIP